jgi:hypothetical protein
LVVERHVRGKARPLATTEGAAARSVEGAEPVFVRGGAVVVGESVRLPQPTIPITARTSAAASLMPPA